MRIPYGTGWHLGERFWYTTTQKNTHMNLCDGFTITNIPAWFIGYLGIELNWSFWSGIKQHWMDAALREYRRKSYLRYTLVDNAKSMRTHSTRSSIYTILPSIVTMIEMIYYHYFLVLMIATIGVHSSVASQATPQSESNITWAYPTPNNRDSAEFYYSPRLNSSSISTLSTSRC